MPAVSSVLLTGRDAAGEKDMYEKRLTTNCLMKLLVVEKKGLMCLLVEKEILQGTGYTVTHTTILHNER